MNKLLKKVGCFALAGFSLFVLSACGTVQGEEQEDLNISIWDGETITAAEELAMKVVTDGKDANGKKYNTIKIGEAADFVAAMRDINNYQNFTIQLERDIDMADMPWNSTIVDGDLGVENCIITIDGDNNTIYGLTNMLISKCQNGGTSLVIKDLTIEQANISVNPNDDQDINNDGVMNYQDEIGVGAFVGRFYNGFKNVTFDNCHVKNSLIEGGHWTGGLFGYASGYTKAGQEAFMDILVQDCSVEGNLIVGKGSVGGIVGHATGSAWTKFVANNAKIVNNEIRSNEADPQKQKSGVVMGTVGIAGTSYTINSVTKTGGSFINNLTYSQNDIYSHGAKVDRIYGRLAGGKLYIDGILVVED